ncbi:MAG: hypothetical protein K0S93_282 [Nitrososphaeraceae archaeon]|jgi:hypothetical protein|nr:hypothetical protein [Nitrososphaeraceae archaeon]
MGQEVLPRDLITPFGREIIYSPTWIKEYFDFMAQSSPTFIKEYFDFLKTWSPTLADNNISPSDWRIWLPSAFYLNWSDP